MLPEDREALSMNDAAVASATDEFAVSDAAVDAAELGDADHGGANFGHDAVEAELAPESDEWYGKQPAYPRRTPEQLHTPDLTTRLYVGLWLPGAGALLTYAAMRGNYWAAFVGVELLLVGWFTLAKL
jgi:hypothetical protein